MIVHSRDDTDITTATDQSCSEYKNVLYPPIVSAKFHLILFKYEPMVSLAYDQLDAQFLYFIIVYYSPLHVSSNVVLLIRR